MNCNYKIARTSNYYIFLLYSALAYMILDQNLLTLILTEKKGYSISDIASFELILQIITVILEIPSGIIGDFISRKILLVGARMAYILYGIIFLITDNMALLMLAFVLLGISEALTSGTEESVVAAIDYKNQVKKYLYFSSVVQIVTMGAILLGGVLFNYKWEWIYIIMIIAQVLSIAALITIDISDRNSEINFSKYILKIRRFFLDKSILKVVLAGAIIGGIFSVYIIYLPLMMSEKGFSALHISLFFIVQMIGGFLVTFITGKIANDKDSFKICWISIIFFVIGIIMMIVGFKDIYILGCFLGCIAGNLYFPAITTIINSC